jgi:heterodisulfide reductase subunit B
MVLDLGGKIIANARQRGADMIVVACPLCEINLQGRQREMGVEPRMPIVYFTQLLAVALGRDKEAALGRNLVDPRPVLRAAREGNP